MTQVLVFLISLSLTITFTAAGFSQTITGTLVGTVKDPTGAVLPGVSVKLTRVDTAQVREMVTDERGDFRFVQLGVGVYQLDTELTGFKTDVRSGITIRTDTTSRVDVTLEVGDISEKITVTEDAPLLDSETSSVGHIINSRTVSELPLNTRRFEQLVFLSPGAALPRPGSGIGFRGGVQFGGLRETSNMFILDGVDITDPNVRQPSVRPSVDAIQEFKVLTSAYSAEYGRQAGGMVVVTTKSGTNEFHGTLFEYVRNSMFDAKNYFEPAGRPIADLRRNQFGGTIGGPIRKDRTFFFFNFEALRERKADTRVAAVPRTEWLQGDFSSLLNPSPGRTGIVLQNRLTGQPFPNNIIPANMLNPVAQIATRIYAAPTQNIDSHGGQFVGSPRQKIDTSLITTRVDHQFSQNFNLFFRYSYTRENLLSPFDSRTTISDLPFFSMDDQTRPHAATVSNTWMVTPTTVNELRIGYSRFRQARQNDNMFDFHAAAGLTGFDASDTTPENTGWPAIRIPGFDAGKNSLPDGRGDNNYSISDTLSFRKGAHNLKLGGDVTKYEVNRFNNGGARGTFTFGTRYSGFAFADFILGWADNISRTVGSPHSFLRWNSMALFLQDDWKVTPRLTLNLGVRYELFTPISDPVSDRFVSFDPKTGEVLVVGDGSNPRRNYALPETRFPGIAALARTIPRRNLIDRGNVWNTDYNNFAPRLGFAYRMFGDKTVLRGGYAIFFDMPYTNLGINGLGTGFPFSVNQQANGAANVPNVFMSPGDPLANAGSGSIQPVGVNMDLNTAYVQSFQFGLQHQLQNNLLLELTYVGNKSTNLMRQRNINQPFTDGTTASIASRRPYALYGNVNMLEAAGSGHFDSMQFKVEKRFSTGLQFTSAYTWGHSIDDGEGNVQNNYDFRAERASSDFDIRQRWVANYVYDLPFGTGKSVGVNAGRVVNALIGNWQATGILTIQTGNPLTPTISGNWSNVGGVDRPNLVPGVNPNLPKGQRTPTRWFNNAAFVLPTQNFWGNAGRNIIEGPGVKQMDFSLYKNIPVGESKRLQFRTEVFNITNTPNFALPVVQVNSSTVGLIRETTTSSRQIQFGLRLTY